MRPFQSLLLVVLLVALGLGGYWLITGGDSPGGIAKPLAVNELVREESLKPNADLDSPDKEAEPKRPERTEMKPTSELAVPEVDEEKLRTISGKLIDEIGNGLAGARVYVAARTGLGRAGVDLAEEEAPPWIRREETETNEEGRFELTAPASASIRIAARLSGFAPLDRELSVKATESHDLGNLKMDDSAILSGRVVDSRGNGVSKAELRAKPQAQDGFVFLSAGAKTGRLLCTTDDQGLFRVDQLASGPYKIAITAEGHPSSEEEGTTERPGAQKHDLTWRLEDGLTISGQLAGAPEDRASKTWVRAIPKAGLMGGSEMQTAELRLDGTFVLAGLKEDVEYRVSAREGDQRFWAPVRSDTVVAKAGMANVTLQWRLESALLFRVVDARTGEPIEKFDVKAGVDWPQALKDENGEDVDVHPDGRVRFGGIQAKASGSKAVVRIDATGYTHFKRDDITIRSGEELELGTLRLDPVPLVTVLVVDDKTGEPIRRARVTLKEESSGSAPDFAEMSFEIDVDDSGVFGNSSSKSQTERTNKEGIAVLSSMPGKTCELLAKRKGYANSTKKGILLSISEDLEIEMRLQVGGSVLVTVLDTNGVPVPNVQVEHREPGESDSPMGMIMMGGSGGRVTDSEGKKLFEHLAPGEHRFRAGDGSGADGMLFSDGGDASVVMGGFSGPNGGSAGSDDWESVVVANEVEAEVGLIVPARGALFGKVVESGHALAGAKVQLQEKSEGGFQGGMFGFGSKLSAQTDSRGEFRIEGADVGEYTVVVTHPTRALASEFEAELAEGENDIGTLDLFVCIIEGRVTNQDGDPLEGVRIRPERASEAGSGTQVVGMSTMIFDGGDGESSVEFSNGSAMGGETVTGADGSYRLRGLPPHEELVVVASGDGLQVNRSEPIILNPDDVRTGVDHKMKQGGKLLVIATRADGAEVGFCIVEANHIDGEEPLSEAKSEMISRGDRLTLSELAPGTWSVALRPVSMTPGEMSMPQALEPSEVEVVAGETAEVTLQIP